MSENYEEKYNNLKAECDQMKVDNEEICIEYESTIQMLTESIENFKKEKESLQTKINNLEKEIKKLEKERESLINKNKDKIIDIQNLTTVNEKIKEDMKKMSEKLNLAKANVISLENSNDHYQNKIRQNEALIEDLTSQLESALEENITLQTEYELYKQQNEENLVRKDQEIKDIQNDLANKEKIIKRLNDKRASIRELKQTLQIPKDFIRQYQRKLTTSIPMNELIDSKKREENKKNIEKSVNIEDNKLITPLSNSMTKFPAKFMEIYRKSIGPMNNPFNKVVQKNESIKKTLDLSKSNSKEGNLFDNKSSKDILARINTLKEGSVVDGDVEDKNEKEELEEDENDSTASDKKCFEDLVICDEKDFNIIPIKKLMNESKKIKNQKLADNLKSMLARIQKRKEILIKHQKDNNKKLEKMGFKIKN